MEVIRNSMDWATIRSGLVRHLERIGYGQITLIQYRGVLNRLERYLHERGLSEYSTDIGAEFFKAIEEEISQRTLVLYKTVNRRLDDYLRGEYRLKPEQSQTKLRVPACFQKHLEDYLVYMKLHGRRETTVDNHRYYCSEALCAFGDLGIHNLSYIKPQDIYYAFTLCSSKSNWTNDCKCFLRFLHKTYVTEKDMSVYVPSVRKPQPLPSVYSREETDLLLASIDRSAELGKRNYAMVLLALRLGIRVGDIVGLKLENINFQTKTIEFIQQKTLIPQRLEMTSDVEDSLAIYLSCRRSDGACDSLFISIMPPFGKITRETVGKFVHRFFKVAGICTDGKRYGPHSLRMTLASELVSDNVPYAVVGKLLGHEAPNSTGAYVKFDLDNLRKCALEAPPPSGLLERMFMVHEWGCE
jgi:site-specific recombinase XerD